MPYDSKFSKPDIGFLFLCSSHPFYCAVITRDALRLEFSLRLQKRLKTLLRPRCTLAVLRSTT